MAALSDYLESGLLHHIFLGQAFEMPSGMLIALTSGVPLESDTGSTIPEIPSGIDGVDTGYSRIDLGNPSLVSPKWTYTTEDHAVGSGVIGNSGALVFDTALLDWGIVSGVAVCDSGTHASSLDGGGNLLMYAQLDNPRKIYQGDSVKFDTDTLQISFD
jgi:hypothetical protein